MQKHRHACSCQVEKEESWEMFLSDAFASGTNGAGINADVEVRVHVLNINYGHNKELMEKCPLLDEYAHFVAVSREYLAQGMERQGAYEAAINYCIDHGILKEFYEKTEWR